MVLADPFEGPFSNSKKKSPPTPNPSQNHPRKKKEKQNGPPKPPRLEIFALQSLHGFDFGPLRGTAFQGGPRWSFGVPRIAVRFFHVQQRFREPRRLQHRLGVGGGGPENRSWPVMALKKNGQKEMSCLINLNYSYVTGARRFRFC